jgi:hypothetical protein
MSPRRAVAAGGTSAKAAFGTLVVLLVAVGMMLLVRAAPDQQPFDPRSEADDGTRALVVLLERFGATVDVLRTPPSPGADGRVLVLQDRLNDNQRGQIDAFVRAGGVAVIADPDSGFAPRPSVVDIAASAPSGRADATSESNVRPGTCTIGALLRLRGLFVAEGEHLPVAGGDASCFGDDRHAFVVVRPLGAGHVVALGDNGLFTNRYLRFADNAGLATALLAPVDGAHVSIVLGAETPKTSADIGTGDKTLLDLVRPGVWMALTQLVVAFAVFAVSRAIRPGRPVREPDQVPISGSGLVVATGRLMHRAGHTSRAGWLLRDGLHRDLCAEMRVPSTTSIESLDATLTSRTSLGAGELATVLHTDPVDERQLLALSHRIQEIRDLVLEGVHQ